MNIEQNTEKNSVVTEIQKPLVDLQSILSRAQNSQLSVDIFKTDALNNRATAIMQLASETVAGSENAYYQTAILLAGIHKTDLEKEGMKRVEDFAKKLGISKVGTSSVSNMVRAGRIYASTECTPELRSVTPSKLAEVAAIWAMPGGRKELREHANDIAKMSQKQLREYRNEYKERTGTGKKNSVITEYEVIINGKFWYNQNDVDDNFNGDTDPYFGEILPMFSDEDGNTYYSNLSPIETMKDNINSFIERASSLKAHFISTKFTLVGDEYRAAIIDLDNSQTAYITLKPQKKEDNKKVDIIKLIKESGLSADDLMKLLKG